jgi:hypothetical protein
MQVADLCYLHEEVNAYRTAFVDCGATVRRVVSPDWNTWLVRSDEQNQKRDEQSGDIDEKFHVSALLFLIFCLIQGVCGTWK